MVDYKHLVRFFMKTAFANKRSLVRLAIAIFFSPEIRYIIRLLVEAGK